MKVDTDVVISAPREKIWAAITDIEGSADMISAIGGMQVLHKPEQGLVGLKWRETREMFGKEASETMWITEAVNNQHYCTRAESHGSIYRTRLALHDAGPDTRLSMSFEAQAQTLMASIISVCMGFLIKRSMRKALAQDLQDIKGFVEAQV